MHTPVKASLFCMMCNGNLTERLEVLENDVQALQSVYRSIHKDFMHHVMGVFKGAQKYPFIQQGCSPHNRTLQISTREFYIFIGEVFMVSPHANQVLIE